MATVRLLRVLAALVLFNVSGLAAPSETARGGAWWQHASREEQLGYLAGYIDCGTYDVGQNMGGRSWYTLAPQVTARYADQPERLAQPVSAVLKELIRSQPSGPLDRGGEHHEGKHGFFDGEYWRQAEPEHRLGFIEGYLDCLRIEVAGAQRFSAPAATYVAQVSAWFGIKSDDPGVVRADRAETKIADALRLSSGVHQPSRR